MLATAFFSALPIAITTGTRATGNRASMPVESPREPILVIMMEPKTGLAVCSSAHPAGEPLYADGNNPPFGPSLP